MSEIILSLDDRFRGPGSVTLAPVRTKSDPHGRQVSTLRYRSRSVVFPGIRHLGDPPDLGVHPVLTWPDHISGLSGQCGAVALIQRSSGCRVSEALGLQSTDIVPPDSLLILALKGSRHRIVRIPELSTLLTLFSAHPAHPLFHLSYSKVYRQYKAAGIIEYCGDNRHNRVTHKLRRTYIQAVQLVSKDIGITADVVGHKSTRSTIIYLQKGSSNG